MANELNTEGILPIISVMKEDCKDIRSINTIRGFIYKKYPLRPKPCPYGGMRCCGSCTRSCVYRCAMDSYNKCCQILLHGMDITGTISLDKLRMDSTAVSSVYNVLSDPDTTYDRLTATANAIITRKTNPNVADTMSMFQGERLQRENHPYSYDYSPEECTWVNNKTGKVRRVVDSQGYIQFRDYPDTGLCAYCMPKNTVDRSRMTKAERISLDSSF